jgi:hypothetical protein
MPEFLALSEKQLSAYLFGSMLSHSLINNLWFQMNTMPNRQAVVQGPASSIARNHSCVSSIPVSTDSLFYVIIFEAA